MSDKVTEWLGNLGLGKYQKVFAENDIDLDVLAHLTDQDLKELGLSLGHRRKLIAAIEFGVSSNANEAQVEHPTKVTSLPQRSEAERRQLTVMFVDMVGSTALSEQLDPEELRELILAYQNTVVEEITRYEGHIARFTGDGVLAYFGWPRAHEDEAERAVRAGLSVVTAVAQLRTAADEPLAARVGIATGVVVVGDLIGEGSAREEAVVGETPNLAARLQALAEPGSVVIGPSTRRLVGGLFELTNLGSQNLKGFAKPLEVWKVVGLAAIENRFEAMHLTELSPLVGREHELGLLIDRWQLAKAGEGRVVLLAGEPGIGKSRLTQALMKQIEAVPHARLRYYCSPYHTHSALHPVIEQLKHATGYAADDSAEVRLDKLEAIIRRSGVLDVETASLLAELLSIPSDERYPPLNLTPQAKKVKTFEVLLTQLENLAASQPVWIVLEDAHWIDPSTSELFEQLIDCLASLPVLLIITLRPEFTPPWSAHTHVTTLTLSRLGQGQGAAIIERLTDGKALPPEVMERILDQTDGVPLFVEELTQTVLESGMLTDAGDHYEMSGVLPALAIPLTLRDSLMARLDHLAPVKEIAQIGAVIGREFSHQLLAAVADRPEPELSAALDQLVAAELIFRRGAATSATYIFKHALIQDAAYESLLKSRRLQLHARIAEVLESSFAEVAEIAPELIARNFTLAGEITRAVPYWHRAGLQATARSANIEAIAHLRTGLDLLRDLPDHSDLEADLQLTLGTALAATKGYGSAETMEAFVRAGELARSRARPELIYPALDGQIVCHFSSAELGPALQFAEEFLDLAKQHQDVAPAIAAHSDIGVVLLSGGKLDLAETHFEQAIALFDPQQHDDLRLTYGYDFRVIALAYLGWAQLALGYPDQAKARSETAIATARAVEHPFSLGFALARSITVHQLRRDVDAVDSSVQVLHTLASEQSFTTYVNMAAFYRGWVKVQRGQSQEGASLIADSLEALRASKDQDFFPHALAVEAEALLITGDHGAALDRVDEGLERVARNQEGWFEAELLRLRGRLLSAIPGASDESEECFRCAIEVSRRQGAKLWELCAARDLATHWRDQGRQDEAHDLLSPIYGWFTEGIDIPDLKNAKALLEELTSSNESNFTLRDALESDYNFAKKLYIQTMKPLLMKFDAWDEAVVMARFDGYYELGEMQVILINGKDVGWLQISESEHELELAQIHIKQAFCSRGIGTQLIRKLMNEARGKGKSVFLSVVRGNPALSLYRRLGFAIVSEDEHKLHMRWEID